MTGHRPLHLRPAALAQVAAGGVLGAAAREAVEQALPAAGGAFPWATLLINLSGALLLGVLLEALVRSGDDDGLRRQARLTAGTGFLGAFTTYSTFAVETDLLVRNGHPATAALYVAASVLGGLLAAGAGVRLAARRAQHVAPLPFDPDADE